MNATLKIPVILSGFLYYIQEKNLKIHNHFFELDRIQNDIISQWNRSTYTRQRGKTIIVTSYNTNLLTGTKHLHTWPKNYLHLKNTTYLCFKIYLEQQNEFRPHHRGCLVLFFLMNLLTFICIFSLGFGLCLRLQDFE